jgi:tetratricopeptide (TPR) repeat protein
MGDLESQPQRGSFNDFVGRERELGELRAGLDDALAGRGRLFLISGEPGIGKTRLGEEISRDAAARGMRVMWGRCWEGGGAPAYWPFIQVLRALVEGVPANDLVAKLGPHAHEIARILPEFYPVPAPESSSPHLDPEQARFRIFDSVATLLKNSARASPLLLVLDDLHEADQPSLLMLRFLARELRDSRILVIGTYREAEVKRSHDLSRLIGELAHEGCQTLMQGLTEDEVAQFIEHSAGKRAEAELVSSLHQATGGNPLFVEAIVRLLIAERDPLDSKVLTAGKFRIPQSVRESIHRQLAGLRPRAQSMLSCAAAIGNDFEAEVLRRAVELPPDEILDLLDEAKEAGVVGEIDPPRGEYRFSHSLIRGAIYEELRTTDRLRLHRLIGETLEQLHGSNPQPYLAQLAHHFRQAGTKDKAINYSIRAGHAAYAVFAYEEAAAHWKAALEIAGEFGAEPARRADLLVRLGDELLSPGIKAVEYLEAAAPIYEGLGDHDRAAEVHSRLGLYLSGPNLGARDVRRAMEHFRKAEAQIGNRPELSSAGLFYARKAAACIWARRIDEGIAAAGCAMDIGDRTGDGAAKAFGACLLAGFLISRGSVAKGLELSNLARTISNPIDDTMLGSTVAWTGGLNYLGLDDPREAQVWFARELSLPRTARSAPRRAILHLMMVLACADAGDLLEARQHLAHLAQLGSEAPSPLAFVDGDWESANEQLTKSFESANATADRQGESIAAFGLARLHRVRGEFVRAREAAEHALSIATETGDVWYELRVRPELSLILEAAGQAREAIPNLERCREILAGGEDWRGLVGGVARAEAVVAAAEASYEDADTQFERAIASYRCYGLPWEEAETLRCWGRALMAAGQSDRAIDKFDAAIEIYRSHGAGARWIERVELDRKGAPSAHTAEPPPASGSAQHDNGVAAREAAGSYSFRREAEYWSIVYEGQSFRLKDSKGLAYIAHLLRHPAKEFHVIELANVISGGEQLAAPAPRDEMWDLRMSPGLGDAGAMLDPAAKAVYKQRLDELREELEEAREFNDPGRAEKADKEIEFLSHELARAVGLSGRDRKAASHAERSRVKVTKAIRVALSHIASASPALAHHLEATIKTGEFCVYSPEPRASVPWQL